MANHLVIAAFGRGGWRVCCAVFRLIEANRLAPTYAVGKSLIGRVWWLTPIALQCTIEFTGKIERRDTRTQLHQLLVRFGVSAFFRKICLLWV